MHIHWYRKTGRRFAANQSGIYGPREIPEDIEFECRCNAKMWKRKHVSHYPIIREAPLRPLERAHPTNEWTRCPDGGWWRNAV